MRGVEVERARNFAKFDRNHSYVFHGAASMVEYARRHGYGSRQTRDYVAAGRVFEVFPEAVDHVLDGSMLISTLAALAPLILEPDLVLLDKAGLPMTHEELVRWARVETDREIFRTVRRLREEVRVGGGATSRTLYLSAQGVEDLERARTLLARRMSRAVSDSEATEHTLRDWVSRNDDLETRGRERRTAAMPERGDGTRNTRYVPAEVRRALMGLHGDRCAIQGCPHQIWLQNAHKTPHALGGGNELRDQIRLCIVHHTMWDHGELRWIEDAAWPCGGYFETPEGRILRLKRPRAEAPRVEGPRPPESAEATGPPTGGDPPSGRRDAHVPEAAPDGPREARKPRGLPGGADRVRERGPFLRPARRTRCAPGRQPTAISLPADRRRGAWIRRFAAWEGQAHRARGA
jgi:hypothetical protein